MTTIGVAGLLCAATIGASSTEAAVSLSVTPTSTARVSPSSSGALTGLSVSGDTTDTLQATVATDLGTLTISTTTGLTLGYNNSWSGTSSITFTGLQSDIDAALATATLVTSSTTGTAHVGLTAMVAVGGYNYLASNQHFYEYVANSGVTWSAADAAAKLLRFGGQPGYLVAIPNAIVNSFVSTKIANATNVWFGARAYESFATDGTQANATVSGTTYPRVWRWTAGSDESPIAGNVITECTNAVGGCTVANGGSFYSSWASSEPNNSGGSSSTAYQGEYVPVTNWGGTSGAWNDLPPSFGASVSGYVVEFGGKANIDSSLGTGFAGVVTATSNVLVATSASLPSAPAVTATSRDASADLSWTPASDGGSAITGYEVSVDGGSFTGVSTSSSSTIVNGNLVTTVTATVAGLDNGTSYGIRVRAINSVGNGASSSSVAITPATVPAPPTGVDAIPGAGSASVEFTPPSDNGGAAITGYTATAAPGGAASSCLTSPCTVTGLTNGASYQFTVHATNAAGNSAESDVSTPVTPATVPGTPTSVVAVRGNGSATISFGAPGTGGSAITGYRVTSSPDGVVMDCAASPCVITGLSNGTSYTFTVHATNDVGSGSESSASSAVTPATVPGAPTGASAARGNASATVTFGAPASNGGMAVTSYTATASPGGSTGSCSVSPCSVSGLANGTGYTFTVHATNVIGDGGESSPSSSVTPATVPGAPTSASAGRGDGQATVSFDAPAGTGGSVITGYVVTVSPGGATVPCTTSPCVVSGLANGTAYTFTVHATNDVGAGGESTASSAVTPAGIPSAPNALVVLRGNGSATLTFDASAANGSAITGYESSIDAGASWQPLTTTGTVQLGATVTALSNGTPYDFEVRAVNSVGAGFAAGPQSATPATVPDPPTGVGGLRGDGQVTVSWAAADSGGSPIVGYRVTASPGGATCSGAATTCDVPALVNGTSYTFTVHATNTVGDSSESTPSSSVTPATVPGAPTSVTALRGDGLATVSFSAPASTGGSIIIAYLVTVSPGGATSPCSSSPCVVLSLTNGAAYTVTVHATNDVGAGAESSVSAPVTPAAVPTAPGSLAVERDNASALLTFDAAADNGSTVTGYESSIDHGGSWQPLTTTGTTHRSATLAGLSNGTLYGFEVRAVNDVGPGAVAGPRSATPATVPGAPSAADGVRGNGSATVTFATPAASGGSAVTSFTVTASPGHAIATCAASPCVVANLSNGVTYTFTVHATNAVGSGSESPQSAAVTPATVPDTPASLAVKRGNRSAELTFDAPSDNGSAIVAYEVSPDGGTTWLPLPTTGTTHLTAILGGLGNGIAYDIEVRAVNDVGSGAAAGPWSMTPAAVPGIPTNVSVVRDNGTALLTFTAPLDSGGSVVTGFMITISPGGAIVSCQASPCLITGLASGVAYTFSVRATNAVGGGIESPTARVPAHSGSFRIQVDYRVPAVCAPRCTAHAEIRTRSGRRLYTLPLPGDGQVVLGSRASLRLTGGTNARFSITIDRAKLLRAPFATVGGKRVANTRLRVWLTTASGTQLTVRDGRIAVSVARIESGGPPLLALSNVTRELGRNLALEPWAAFDR